MQQMALNKSYQQRTLALPSNLPEARQRVLELPLSWRDTFSEGGGGGRGGGGGGGV